MSRVRPSVRFRLVFPVRMLVDAVAAGRVRVVDGDGLPIDGSLDERVRVAAVALTNGDQVSELEPVVFLV